MNTLIFRYATSVVPIGTMFAMTLWLGNSAYLYISVAFAQMLKATSKCYFSLTALIFLDFSLTALIYLLFQLFII